MERSYHPVPGPGHEVWSGQLSGMACCSGSLGMGRGGGEAGVIQYPALSTRHGGGELNGRQFSSTRTQDPW